MTIKVSMPSNSIINGICREFLNRGINIPGNEELACEMREILVAGLQNSLALNKGLFGLKEMSLETSIEIRDDIGEITPEVLATFDLYRSDLSGFPHFSVSSHLVLAEFLAKYAPDDPAVEIRKNAFWSHELVHAADWATLSHHPKLYDEQKGKHLMSSFNDSYADHSSGIPREAVGIASSASERLMQTTQTVIQHMNKNIPVNLDRSTAIELIKTGLNIDLGSFIQRLSDTSFKHPWVQLLDFAQVGWLCNFISYNGNEPNDDFILNLYEVVLHHNHELFLKDLREVVGSPMELDEIKTSVEALASSPLGTGAAPVVHDEAITRAQRLLGIFFGASTQKQKEIALLALTYFVDVEDYIRDDLHFMGKLTIFMYLGQPLSYAEYNPT
jgi:hypothetical protein